VINTHADASSLLENQKSFSFTSCLYSGTKKPATHTNNYNYAIATSTRDLQRSQSRKILQ